METKFLGLLPYKTGLQLLDETHTARRSSLIPDTVLYLEHEPVITYGRATPPADLIRTHHSIPMIETPRGGLATYHGPGQLIGYPVINLADRSEDRAPDIHLYLRTLEEALIAFVVQEYKLPAGTREGFTGVWTKGFDGEDVKGAGRKLASIGISARKWVTSHGFALNINPDMCGFEAIVPCGIMDAPMTSIANEFRRAGTSFPEKPMKELAGSVHNHLALSLKKHGWLMESMLNH